MELFSVKIESDGLATRRSITLAGVSYAYPWAPASLMIKTNIERLIVKNSPSPKSVRNIERIAYNITTPIRLTRLDWME
jgi:hypothetical protein